MAMDTGDDFKAIARKLYIQFGHPKPEKLIKLLKDGGNGHKNLIRDIKEISENGLTCIKR